MSLFNYQHIRCMTYFHLTIPPFRRFHTAQSQGFYIIHHCIPKPSTWTLGAQKITVNECDATGPNNF